MFIYLITKLLPIINQCNSIRLRKKNHMILSVYVKKTFDKIRCSVMIKMKMTMTK